MKTAIVVRSAGADQWADRICKQLGQTVDSILEVGRLLVKAKNSLPHGEFGRLFTDDLVPFSHNTAHRLMAIATHPLISKCAHGHNLPTTWRTLYELTKVEPKRLTAALKDGTITPDMPRKAVAALLPPRTRRLRPSSASEDQGDDDPFDERTALAEVIHAIRSHAATWPADVPLTTLVAQLRHEADRLEERQQRQAS